MMIESLKYLPQPTQDSRALAEHFTDLAPALNARQAAIESSRCLYCYDAPCSRICPSEIDVAGFIRNIHDGNVNGAAAGGIFSSLYLTTVCVERSSAARPRLIFRRDHHGKVYLLYPQGLAAKPAPEWLCSFDNICKHDTMTVGNVESGVLRVER